MPLLLLAMSITRARLYGGIYTPSEQGEFVFQCGRVNAQPMYILTFSRVAERAADFNASAAFLLENKKLRVYALRWKNTRFNF